MNKTTKKYGVKHMLLVIVIIFVVSIAISIATADKKSDDIKSNNIIQQNTPVNQEANNSLLKIKSPIVDDYENPVKIMGQDDYISLSYTPKGTLSNQISSASVDIMKRKNPDELYDYSSFNDYFSLDNSEITIEGATGRMGYQDYRTYEGTVMSQKYETIQVEVTKGDIHYAVQLGHAPNNYHDPVLYKQEAIKIIKALLMVYSK